MSQTWDDFLQRQQAFINELQGEAKAFGIAVSSTHSDVSERIFVKGEASDGSVIGYYNSGDPLYIDTKVNAPTQVPPRGKPGHERNVANRKTTYFESYRDFRISQADREADFVNLRLTGVLQSDFNTGLVQINATTWQAILKNAANVKKARGNEDRFKKKIFDVTQTEQTKLAETFDFEIQKQLNAINA